jgi:predicted O-methyltransferase YrrM
MNCVEIGSFEGRGSLIIEDLLCSHEDSRLYCIDPWDDVYVKSDPRFNSIDPLFSGQYSTFLNNTSTYTKIVPMRGTSDAMITRLFNDIDFVYIDGDHSPEQVYKDGVNMFTKMKSGGIMVFDDYVWEHDGIKCKDGVDRFLKEYESKCTIIHMVIT